MRAHLPASRAAKRQRRRRKKRTSALPRLPACRALSRQIGKCIFCLLGAFRIWFGYLEHLQITLSNHSALKSGMAAPVKHCRRGSTPRSGRQELYQTPQVLTAPSSLRRSIGAMRRHYRFSRRVKGVFPSPTAAVWLTRTWLTRGPHIFRPPLFANLLPFLAGFDDSRIPLNMPATCGLTMIRSAVSGSRLLWPRQSPVISMG